MSLSVLGISHHTAPVEVRERVALAPSEVPGALLELKARLHMSGAVLLSTCNRTELYMHADDGTAIGGARRFLEARAGALDPPLSDYLYVREDQEAVRHLFRVASGLDAMVVGEGEIQGQVRQAYGLSAELDGAGALVGAVLHRLFQMALAVGGRVREETTLGEGTGSVANVAVQLARKIFGTLSGRRVVVLGAGDTSQLVVDALGREGVSGVVVANRTYERAESLADRLEGRAVHLMDLSGSLTDADLVVASTAAPHAVLTRTVFQSAFPEGLRRPLLMIDLSIPRDIEPGLGEETNLFLYNVDDLRQIVDANMARRQESVPAAERIVEEMTVDFLGWYGAQEAVPLIRSLRDRADQVRRRELQALLDGMRGLSDDQRSRLENFSRRLLNKLLHDPTVRLKEGAAGPSGASLLDAARFLYALDATPDESGPEHPQPGKICEDDDDP